MAKYTVSVGEWVSPDEVTGSIQCVGRVPIEVSSENKENTGLIIRENQIIAFEGTVYVRSTGNRLATFTTVPFKVNGKGGGGGGGGSIPYTLPTMSANIKGGAKVGSGLKMQGDKLNIDAQAVPTAKVTQTASGATITLVDIDGTTTANIYNGTNGVKGSDGYSPTVAVTNITNGHKVSITDKTGTKDFNVMNGTNGTSGVSPSASVSKTGDTATITIQDASGTTSAKIRDGAKGDKGDKGEDGKSFTIRAQYETLADLEAAHPTGTVNDAYLVGDPLEDEVPYLYMWLENTTTHVYSWENCGKIVGMKGDKGDKGDKGESGVSPSITVVDNPNGTHTVTIVSAEGTSTTVISDGVDGYSPTVSLTKATGAKYSTLSITDKNGTQTVTINDGVDGESPTTTIDETVVGQHKIIFTDPDGTKHVTIIYDGNKIAHWAANTQYESYQIVIYDDCLYECKIAHTSGSNFDVSKWNELGSESVLVLEDWATNTEYKTNQVINYANSLYRCNNSHTSSSIDFETDIGNWDLVFSDLKNWQLGTYYSVGNIVIYNNKLYRCNTAHISDSSFNDNKWDALICNSDVTLLYDWAENTEYVVNEIVYYNNLIYRCKVAHTSSSSFDNTKFDLVINNKVKIKNWVTNNLYELNEIVYYNRRIYRCVNEHTSSVFSTDYANWELIYSSVDIWRASVYFAVGVVVVNDSKLYRCSVSHVSRESFDSTELNDWEELSVCDASIFEWKASTEYDINDLVSKDGNIYKCTIAHTSGTSFDLEEQENWTTLWTLATKSHIDALFI